MSQSQLLAILESEFVEEKKKRIAIRERIDSLSPRKDKKELADLVQYLAESYRIEFGD